MFRDYLSYFYEEGRKRYEAGMSWQDAAFDLAWGEFRDWGDPERVVINMTTLYRELSGAPVVEDTREIWELMGRYHYGRVAERHDHDPRSEEHTSELQSLMRISYAVFCLKKKKT